jgi:hypothetical protein
MHDAGRSVVQARLRRTADNSRRPDATSPNTRSSLRRSPLSLPLEESFSRLRAGGAPAQSRRFSLPRSQEPISIWMSHGMERISAQHGPTTSSDGARQSAPLRAGNRGHPCLFRADYLRERARQAQSVSGAKRHRGVPRQLDHPPGRPQHSQLRGQSAPNRQDRGRDPATLLETLRQQCGAGAKESAPASYAAVHRPAQSAERGPPRRSCASRPRAGAVVGFRAARFGTARPALRCNTDCQRRSGSPVNSMVDR